MGIDRKAIPKFLCIFKLFKLFKLTLRQVVHPDVSPCELTTIAIK